MSKILDVAVIGGGVAGTYCAWRLTGPQGLKEGQRRVALFEYSDRIGGRLYTKTFPGMPNVAAELGGMRYIVPEKDDPTSNQPMVSNLIEALDLPSHVFLMGNPEKGADGQPIGEKENILYLRGKHLLVKQQSDPAQVPYNLSWNERGKTVNDLQVFAMNLLVPNNQNLSLEQWMETRVYGHPLYTYGFWNLMSQTLSSEAYQFMKDAGGYDANVANANAVAQLPATEYANTDGFRAITGGYQRLPLTLAEQAAEQGAEIHMNRRLAKIEKDADGHYKLTFIVTETRVVDTDFGGVHEETKDKEGVPPEIVHARDIILGLPRRSLELIDWEGWDQKGVKEMLSSVLIQDAFKLLLAYDYPWWRAMNLVAGRSITDLPVRQIYYFGTEEDQPGGEKGNTRSLLMASYNDITTVPFWKGLEHGPPFVGRRPKNVTPLAKEEAAATGDDQRVVPLAECIATDAMVSSAHRQILEVHGLVDVDQPYSAIYHDWSGDPYGGGWHEWKAGFRYNLLMPKIRQPLAAEKVYICGEAYSNNQGWVEGCLQTAEHVLRDKFHLPWPEYLTGLPPEKILGP
ncbi:FAD-dependent oxidoreductase [Nitrospirillum sp. BR 11752]|uniref:flavin monoamine oxidase family protein n=1 Tax=Nitrospirillum sp. BR 11752 TaxID=3104293 RepID=UPI002EAC93DD|nr:FAD-dependent oxidoreductase [Nitrospirillum sp. BR 11752]